MDGLPSRDELTQLRVGEGSIRIRLHGEPYVVPTFRGYAPVLEVEDLHARTRHFLYITAKSFMEAVEPLRAANGGKFHGLEFEIRKTTDKKFARFAIVS